MKKILLATTMLVAGASIAAAQETGVSLSGDARMGIVHNGEEANFSSRARVLFTMSGETDGGLTFGASFRAHEAGAAEGGTAGSVFISGAFGTLTMGAPVGAAESAVGDLDGVGYVGVGDYTDTLFLTGDGVEAGFDETIALYSYSAGGFTGYLSTADGNNGTAAGFDSYAIGASYTMGDYAFGLGYEKGVLDVALGTFDATHIVASATATFGAVKAKLIYGQADLEVAGVDAGEADQLGLGATYTMDALSVTGFYKGVDIDSAAGVSLAEIDAYGQGVGYDLGGGAAIKGIVSNIEDTLNGFDDTVYDLGVTFTF